MSRTEPVPLPAVLIVKDDPTIGHHLQLGLEGHGYSATWCRTGTAATTLRGYGYRLDPPAPHQERTRT
jgi:hypothetical protein